MFLKQTLFYQTITQMLIRIKYTSNMLLSKELIVQRVGTNQILKKTFYRKQEIHI